MVAVNQRRVLVWLVLLGVAGLGTKFYSGPGALWINHQLGGVLYEIFWCFAVWFCWPQVGIGKIASGVFVVTCGLEVLQLWHPAWLESIRESFLGHAILGSSFDAWDFLHYALGCVIGWGWMRMIQSG
jgi:hypothetical protein